jgi:hypothetical protein
MSIKGIGNKDNLKDWADYAKSNSYKPDRAQSKHDLSGEGCDQDIKEGLPLIPKQKREEGKGYAPIDRVTERNTYTTKDGGTKHG